MRLRMLFLVGIIAGFGHGRSASKRFDIGWNRPFKTLREALAIADSNAVLVVHPGVYPETGLVVNKPMTLRGMGWPALDARGLGALLNITADNVRITGFVFKNVGVSYLKDQAAVNMTGTRGARIDSNRFVHNFFSIYGSRSRNTRIDNNDITGRYNNEVANGNGVHLWQCDSMTVKNNKARGHRDGIYLEFTGHSTVTGNLAEKNIRYGLHFMFSNGSRYAENTFRNNGSGVAVMYSNDVRMEDNRFEHNWGSAAYGLLCKGIEDSKVRGNIFVENTVGVFQEGLSRVQFEENAFVRNGWALKMVANCDDNVYENNRFSGNTFDVSYNSSAHNSNAFHRNSWDKYRGYDLNRDGLGDVPYRPVELQSVLMDRYPEALILMRGHFLTLLNLIEKQFPALAPRSLEDDSPLFPPRKDS
jgi:nitrous oxidase accessory protein